MSSQLRDKLSQWARTSAPSNVTPIGVASPKGLPPEREVYRNGRDTYDIPSSVVEAKMRLAEYQSSLAKIERDLASRAVDQFASPADFESWRAKASTAHGYYEQRVERMKVYIIAAHEPVESTTHGARAREAEDACQRLGSEVERLNTIVAGLKADSSRTAPLNAAFVDVARVVLAETTFARIYERARDKAASAAKL